MSKETNKLSKLQRKILTLAFNNSRDMKGDYDPTIEPDLYARDVLASCFDFPTMQPGWQWCLIAGGSLRRSFGQNFDRREIGRARYNAAAASVSRAFQRLEQRGLIKRHARGGHWLTAGIYLTPEGRAAASSLSES